MQALLAQGYAGKIDLIYIDPPFLSSADYGSSVCVMQWTGVIRDGTLI